MYRELRTDVTFKFNSISFICNFEYMSPSMTGPSPKDIQSDIFMNKSTSHLLVFITDINNIKLHSTK